jgi:predicted Zn-dependent peptidase
LKHSVSEMTLKNGAKGLLIDVPDATVMDFEFNFRAGEYLVDPKKWEVPHLMEHVLLGANQYIPKARTFQMEFEKNGAANNASTGLYYITYEAECADFEWQRILELLLIAISRPLFLPDEYKAEFGNVKDELMARSNNHFRTLSMTDRERLKMMKNVRRKDLEEHYKRTHTTSNLRFIIAGNIKGKREKIRQIVEAVALPKGRQLFDLPDEIPKKLDQAVFVARPSVKNVYFDLQTFVVNRFDDPQMDALELVNGMLTGTLYSRILGEARERGLVYSMGSGVDVMKVATGWWFSAQVLARNAPALFEIIVRELNAIRAGDINQDDLDSAKMYWLGRHQRGAQTVAGTMAGYTGRYYFDEAINNYDAIPERIKAVSRDRIVEVSQQMFSGNIGGLAVLGGGGRSRELANQLNDLVQPLWS